jgi:hypothetical protein
MATSPVPYEYTTAAAIYFLTMNVLQLEISDMA